MIETFRKQLVQRITRSFLDILILRLIETEPMWGYRIIKKTQQLFGVQLRHGALYPLLNNLSANGLLIRKETTRGGRKLKMYELTSQGTQFVEAYYTIIREQLEGLDLKEP